VPVHRLLGGPVREKIPVYASPIPFLPTVDESAAWALSFVDSGFHAVKLKLGRGEPTDLAHAAAVVEALGELGVHWFEEPLPTDDVADSPRYAGRCGSRW
jgi:L-alanine-DL-glutamate epimerase-like enolase superfamily enzyme